MAKRTRPSTEKLAAELFAVVEHAQGHAFISDAESPNATHEEFFSRVRGRLAWTMESARILRKFLRKYGQGGSR